MVKFDLSILFPYFLLLMFFKSITIKLLNLNVINIKIIININCLFISLVF